MNVVIRTAALEDAAAIALIYAHYVLTSTATFELEPPDAHEIAQRIERVFERSLPYLVAEVDGAIAGYGYAAPFRPRPAYQFTVEDTVYLHRDYSGRGLGRRLLEELIVRCRTAGCRQMIGVIGGDNPASVALHKTMGFTEAGLLHGVGFKLGQWLDVTLLQRPL